MLALFVLLSLLTTAVKYSQDLHFPLVYVSFLDIQPTIVALCAGAGLVYIQLVQTLFWLPFSSLFSCRHGLSFHSITYHTGFKKIFPHRNIFFESFSLSFQHHLTFTLSNTSSTSMTYLCCGNGIICTLSTPSLDQLAECCLSTDITRKDHKRHTAMARCLFITSPQGYTRSRLANNQCAFGIQALGSSV